MGANNNLCRPIFIGALLFPQSCQFIPLVPSHRDTYRASDEKAEQRALAAALDVVEVLSHVVSVQRLGVGSATGEGFRDGKDRVGHALVTLTISERVTARMMRPILGDGRIYTHDSSRKSNLAASRYTGWFSALWAKVGDLPANPLRNKLVVMDELL